MKNTIEKKQMTVEQAKACVLSIKGSLGSAQAEILALHDQKGWEALGHSSWKECCEKEFGYSERHGYRLIEAARLNAETDQLVSPLKESQARVLAKIPKELREEVLETVKLTGEPVTAKAITEAAKALADAHADTGEPIVDVPSTPLDRTGHPIPATLRDAWRHAEDMSGKLLGLLSEAKCLVDHALDAKDPAFREIPNTFVSQISACHHVAKQVKPHSVCPTCHGKAAEKCEFCRGRGVVSRFRYELLGKELRDMREKAGKSSK